MEKSTHQVTVVRLGELTPHPEADTLLLAKVWEYDVILKKGEFKEGDLIAYIPPDSITNDGTRIKAMRLRGRWSTGLCVPAPEGSQEGDDVASILGVTHYEPPVVCAGTGGQDAHPPKAKDHTCGNLVSPVYDVDSGYKYAKCMVEGEPCHYTEKLHGTSSRFVYASSDEKMHCGSHYTWKRRSIESIPEEYRTRENSGEACLWWKALDNCPWLEAWCRAHPDVVVYGEVVGPVQKGFNYNSPNKLLVYVFDLMIDGRWLDPLEARALGDTLVWVPTLYVGPWSFAKAVELSEGMSTLAGHIREGCVIRPCTSRYEPKLNGNLVIKFVSKKYLEKSK